MKNVWKLFGQTKGNVTIDEHAAEFVGQKPQKPVSVQPQGGANTERDARLAHLTRIVHCARIAGGSPNP